MATFDGAKSNESILMTAWVTNFCSLCKTKRFFTRPFTARGIRPYSPLTSLGHACRARAVLTFWACSERRLADRRAAVDEKRLASDEPSILRQHERDGGRKFLWLAEAVHRYVRQEAPLGFATGGRVLPEHFGLGRPRRDRVDRDASLREL